MEDKLLLKEFKAWCFGNKERDQKEEIKRIKILKGKRKIGLPLLTVIIKNNSELRIFGLILGDP